MTIIRNHSEQPLEYLAQYQPSQTRPIDDKGSSRTDQLLDDKPNLRPGIGLAKLATW